MTPTDAPTRGSAEDSRFCTTVPVRCFSKRLAAVASLTIATLAGGCSYYSFTGATIPSHLKTISIPLVQDKSVNVFAAMDDRLTALLTDRFVGQTRLALQPNETDADAVLNVTIDRYRNVPASVSADERASLNRVTISVTVDYYDAVNDKNIIDQAFSSFQEYDPTDPEFGLEGEEIAAFAVLERIADDIFTAATSNW